jgi:hypothetical protein
MKSRIRRFFTNGRAKEPAQYTLSLENDCAKEPAQTGHFIDPLSIFCREGEMGGVVCYNRVDI